MIQTEMFPLLSQRTRICAQILDSSKSGAVCYDCALDNTAIYCMDCFEHSDHRGHRFVIKTKCEGCCDCGDIQAFKQSSFCPKHTGQPFQQEIDKQVKISFCRAWTQTFDRILKAQKVFSEMASLKLLYQKCTKSMAYCQLVSELLCAGAPCLVQKLMDKCQTADAKQQAEFNLFISKFFIALFQVQYFKNSCAVYFTKHYQKCIRLPISNMAVQFYTSEDSVIHYLHNSEYRIRVSSTCWNDPLLSRAFLSHLALTVKFPGSAAAFWKLSRSSYYSLYYLQGSYQGLKQNLTSIVDLNFSEFALKDIAANSFSMLKDNQLLMFQLATDHLAMKHQPSQSANFLYPRTFFLLLLILDRTFPHRITTSMLQKGAQLVKQYMLRPITVYHLVDGVERCHPDLMEGSLFYNHSLGKRIDQSFLQLLAHRYSSVFIEDINFTQVTLTLSFAKQYVLTNVELALSPFSKFIVYVVLGLDLDTTLSCQIKTVLRHLFTLNPKMKITEFENIFSAISNFKKPYQKLLKLVNQVAEFKTYFTVKEPVLHPDPYYFTFQTQFFNSLSQDGNFQQLPVSQIICPFLQLNLLKNKNFLSVFGNIGVLADDEKRESIKLCKHLIKIVYLHKNAKLGILVSDIIGMLYSKGFLQQHWKRRGEILLSVNFQQKTEDEQQLNRVRMQPVAKNNAQLKLKKENIKTKIKQKMQKRRETAIGEEALSIQKKQQQCLICRQVLSDKQFGLLVFLRQTKSYLVSELLSCKSQQQKQKVLDKAASDIAGIDATTCGHLIHFECYGKLAGESSRCPLCRNYVNLLIPLKVAEGKQQELLDEICSKYLLDKQALPKLSQLAIKTIIASVFNYESDSVFFMRFRLKPLQIILQLFKTIFLKGYRQQLYEIKSQSQKYKLIQQAVSLLLGESCIPASLSLKVVAGLDKPHSQIREQKLLLLQLPTKLSQFHQKYALQKCKNCCKFKGQLGNQLALCLLCQTSLCSVTCTTEQSQIGNLNSHAFTYHGSSCAFLGIGSLLPYYVSYPFNCMDDKALYVDEFGRNYNGQVENMHMYRLSYERMENLNQMTRRNAYNQVVSMREYQGIIYMRFAI